MLLIWYMYMISDDQLYFHIPIHGWAPEDEISWVEMNMAWPNPYTEYEPVFLKEIGK